MFWWMIGFNVLVDDGHDGQKIHIKQTKNNCHQEVSTINKRQSVSLLFKKDFIREHMSEQHRLNN
jgi:hypothetical protein